MNNKGIKNEILVGSADVKALYPSLEINHTAKIVAEVFYKSDYSVKEIDKRELSLYLALKPFTAYCCPEATYQKGGATELITHSR